MTLEKLITHFYDHPSYLETGGPKLAKQFNVSLDLINQAKAHVRGVLKTEIMKDLKQETISFRDFAKHMGIDMDEVLPEDYDFISARTLSQREVIKEDVWEEKVKWVKTKGESKLLVKKKELDEVDLQKEFEVFINNLANIQKFEWNYQDRLYPTNPDLCLVLCLFDVHIGRESYKHYVNEETDIQSQQEEFVSSLNKIVQKIPYDRLEKIILPIGNDFFNVDTPTLTTTKGTPQDNTKDLYSMFYTGLNLLSEVAIYLSSLAPVELLLIPGNHDTVTSMYLATSLKVIFRDNPLISVDDSPTSRKYRQYGKTTLGFAHGDLKIEKYAELLPYEAKEMFATSQWYEFLLGDKHHEKMVQKEDGVVVRHLGGMTKADVWTYHNGYTTSKRRAYGILYDKEQGRTIELIHQL